MVVLKDRTNLYLSFRSTYPVNRKYLDSATQAGQTTHLLHDDLDLDLEMGESEDTYKLFLDSNDKSQNIDMIINNIILPIDKNLDKIDVFMKKLEQEYKTAILPSFNDKQEEDYKKIERTSFEIMKLIQMNFNYIKFIKEHIGKDSGKRENEFVIILTNMNTSYATKIQGKSNEFKLLQNKYLKFLNKDDSKPLSKIGKNNESDTLLLLEEEENEIKTLMTDKQNQQLLNSRKKDEYLYKRDQEIVELSQNVLEINTIFKDLQTMIIDQSSIVNNIESNVYEFQNDVVEAKKEIDISERYNKRESKFKIALFLVLLCILVLLLILSKK